MMQKPPQRTHPAGSTPSQWALQDRSALNVEDDKGAVATDDRGAQDLIEQFGASLRGHPELEQEDRDQLLQRFEGAVNDSRSESASSAPKRSDWMEVVESLRKMDAIDDDETNALIRQLDEALQPLQRREVRIAMEFSRRLKEEGDVKALEWIKNEATKAAAERQDADTAALVQNPDPSLRDSITQSRSRRLRGPPQSKR